MPRSRVLSFMSQWQAPPKSPTTDSRVQSPDPFSSPKKPVIDTNLPYSATKYGDAQQSPSPTTQQRFRSDSRAERIARPMSMVQNFQPPVMDVTGDTLPELQPIFSFLNSHSNKLYQEGYFLKLHDLDSRGRPSADRNWAECFAQLVGTVLSLWDAAALDAAGEDGEVLPTFINISDASLKMIESLPMNGSAGGQLQNVLSISTAANNRYLLHFNSLNSLTQWTAGIRLAQYEQATLQEAYTGSLIAGKGKMLNNIRAIMERSKFKTEDWARVRFGAGTPWRRCWCVISPPDEKEYQKAQKTLKKRDNYDRKVQVPKGDIKFYETKKVTKKTQPIATITDAFAAYAIYPQSKPLIDQSTLVKLEGQIIVHGATNTTTEGFIFVMPEVHPAVSGFEMMLRWLFPVYDTFGLYGRPARLVADSLDQRGLMFAMPRNRRYGYLDTLDVSGLIHTKGSSNWTEQDWRTEMKKLTSHRMNTAVDTPQQARGRRNTLATRISMSALNSSVVRFGDDSSDSSPSGRASPAPGEGAIQFAPPRRVDTTPAGSPARGHNRSASDAVGYKRFQSETPSRLSYEATAELSEVPPQPPAHGGTLGERRFPQVLERVPSESETLTLGTIAPAFDEMKLQAASQPAAPVESPPKLMHGPNAARPKNALATPELRRANSAMDAATLQQLAEATRPMPYTEKEQAYPATASREVASVANSIQRTHTDTAFRNEGVTIAPALGHHPYQAARRLPPVPINPSSSDRTTTLPVPRTIDVPPPVPEHNSTAAIGLQPILPARVIMSSPPSGTAQNISRKPVPNPTQTPEPARRPPSPALSTVSSNGSLRNELMEQALLEQMLAQSPETANRTDTIDDTFPDDESVDYASVKSISPPTRKSVERVRAGRMKTVGNPDHQPQVQRSRLDGTAEDMPPINFGPTKLYRPNGRPSSSGNVISGALQEEPDVDQRSSSRLTMGEGRRASYLEGRRTPAGELNQEKRRSIAWQPASAMAESAGQSLTPEQWVQYRASLAAAPITTSRATPVFGHSRDAAGSFVKPPPPSRPASGDLTQQLNQMSLNRTPSGDWGQQINRMSLSKTPPPLSRTPSGDWGRQGPSRPHSRSASVLLQPPSPGRALQSLPSQTLSAHEQMQVARATGTSMLTLTHKDKRKDAEDLNAPGLIGAMAFRERERAIKKENLRTSMVQQAIVARQQQQWQSEFDAQMQTQYQAQEHADLQARQIAHQQAQMEAQHYAQQYAQLQAQMHAQQYAQQQAQVQAQQLAYQQAQVYQHQMNPQRASQSFVSRPGTGQRRHSQFSEHMSQAGGWGGNATLPGWSQGGSPQSQGYAQSYFGGQVGHGGQSGGQYRQPQPQLQQHQHQQYQQQQQRRY